MLDNPIKAAFAVLAVIFTWRIISNRRANRAYAQMTPAQKRLVPRRWL